MTVKMLMRVMRTTAAVKMMSITTNMAENTVMMTMMTGNDDDNEYAGKEKEDGDMILKIAIIRVRIMTMITVEIDADGGHVALDDNDSKGNDDDT